MISGRLDHKQGCCSAADAEDARRVADRLEIPFYALNLQQEFSRIIDYFVDEYTFGRTPNPCVMCNNWIKFGKLFDYADSIGAEFVATGHYARLEHETGGPALLRGVDRAKDQSYVLFGWNGRCCHGMLLPVGGFEKPQIRRLAAEVGLQVAAKKDSQEICFVSSGKHDEFVRARNEADTSGEIVTTSGRVVGEHPGIERFTIGQRKGLGVALGEPRFVVRIERESRRGRDRREARTAAQGTHGRGRKLAGRRCRRPAVSLPGPNPLQLGRAAGPGVTAAGRPTAGTVRRTDLRRPRRVRPS